MSVPRGTSNDRPPGVLYGVGRAHAAPLHPAVDAYLRRRIQLLTVAQDHTTAQFLAELHAVLTISSLADTLTVEAARLMADSFK